MKYYAFADEASAMIDGQIAAMLRNGLQGLEIRNVDGVNVSSISLEKAAEVRRKLDDAGLICWSIGSPIGKIDIVKDDFDAHMQTYLHTIEVAHALGAENIRMFSFYIPKGDDPAIYRNQVIDRLSLMAEKARGTGVTLCHENEKGIYGDLAPRCLEIHQAIPEIAAIFDPANYIQSGQETLSAWEMLKDKVKYLHIKDALSDGSVVPAGHGLGHVPEIVRDFASRGGEALTLEPHLTVFAGLSGLEREGEKSQVGKYVYRSSDEAFDAAAAAMKAL